jgi:hypothetical protein
MRHPTGHTIESVLKTNTLLMRQSILTRFHGLPATPTCPPGNAHLFKRVGVLIAGEAGESPDKLKFCWQHNKTTLKPFLSIL